MALVAGGIPAARTPAWARLLDRIDAVLVVVCATASVAAGVVLTYSVAVRHLFGWSTDWQDEASVFLLVGATFLSAPYVQARRGHVGIEAVRGVLPASVERVRVALIDGICLAFSTSFAWLCCRMFLDAWESGEVTDSAWAPPLWFPYGLMTSGMCLLALRFGVQTVAGLSSLRGPAGEAG